MNVKVILFRPILMEMKNNLELTPLSGILSTFTKSRPAKLWYMFLFSYHWSFSFQMWGGSGSCNGPIAMRLENTEIWKMIKNRMGIYKIWTSDLLGANLDH